MSFKGDITMLIFATGFILFLLGLEGSKKSLEKIAGLKIEKYIKDLTTNFGLSILIGIIITSILQSSSAVSIIVIGLIEAKLLGLRSAIGIIMGANIGTTITIQIISLPILSFYPYLILIGIFFMITGFILRKKIFLFPGITIFSFGIIFTGLHLMSSSFLRPEINKLFSKLLKISGKNIFSGILMGTIVTSIIQSSSAVTGIIVTLAHNNLVSLPMAITISLGSNIGTCITAFIASINASKISKSLATGHFLFNFIGVIILLPFLNIFTHFIISISTNPVQQIANAHTIFNVFNVLFFLPFIKTFISFLRRNI